MTSKSAAILIGIVFLAIGFLGYTANPLVGESPGAIFHADSTHNIVHIVSGILFLLFALLLSGHLNFFLKLFGIVYFLIGIIGLTNTGDTGMGQVAGFLHVNEADNYLHLGLGILIFIAGNLSRSVRR